jgi:hypothetical protein
MSIQNIDKRFLMEKGKISIRINKKEWEIFKEKAKLNESDASKEIRKFIKKYIKDNK